MPGSTAVEALETDRAGSAARSLKQQDKAKALQGFGSASSRGVRRVETEAPRAERDNLQNGRRSWPMFLRKFTSSVPVGDI